MRLRIALSCIGLFIAASPQTAAAQDIMLQPTTKWVMDYLPNSCELKRAFGSGDDQTIVQLVRYEPGAQLDVRVIGKPVSGHQDGSKIEVRFGGTGDFIGTNIRIGAAGKTPAVLFRGRLDNLDPGKLYADLNRLSPAERVAIYKRPSAVSPAREAAVASLTLKLRGKAVVLELGSMGAPMEAMRKCTSDLLKEWGLDPDAQSALASGPMPIGRPETWLRTRDYPEADLLNGKQGMVNVRLMVDAAGQPTGCSVQASIGGPSFSSISCKRLLQVARFDPARDAQGQPASSYYVTTIWFVLF